MLRSATFREGRASHRLTSVLALLVISTLAACSQDKHEPMGPLSPVTAWSAVWSHGRPIPGQYIVVLKREVQDVEGVARALTRKHGGTLRYIYKAALKGFALRLPDAAVTALRAEPTVAYLEQDQETQAATGQPNTTWGLQRVSQYLSLPSGSNPFNNTYTYTYFADGTGVTVYVIDTGIDTGDTDFGGRAAVGFDAFGGNGIDCNGHGTHVSGTVGGTTWGVAKNVHLRAVRVLDCNGNGTTSSVIAGVDWVTANRVLPAVANMSLIGGSSSTLNQAVENSISGGVTYAVAAGNFADAACNYSPQSAPDAIVVGATDIGDNFASFSNFGSCVKINAPGVAITSDWLNNATKVDTGTSMASPHVAGAAALFLSLNGTASPAQVQSALTTNASRGFIKSVPGGTPNLIDYTTFIGAPVTVSGGNDTTLACNNSGAFGSRVCFAMVAAIQASGSSALTVWYVPAAQGGTSNCANVVGSFCTATITLSNATVSGGVDTSLACNNSGPFGSRVCFAMVAATAASGSNAITVLYVPAAQGGTSNCADALGSFCAAYAKMPQ
jgi:aqualysin 1